MAKLGSNGIRVNQASTIEEQAARINELEADLAQSEICIRARMDVIDEQAARILELEAEVLQKSSLCASIMENCNDLRSRAQRAEAELKQCQEWLVEERAQNINPSSTPWNRLTDYDKTDFLYPSLIVRGKNCLREWARQQLHSESKIPEEARP